MKRQKMTDEAAEAVAGLAENATTCTICTEQMYKDVVQAAGCGHLFHRECVKPLTDCPNCRLKNCKFFSDANACKWWQPLLVKCKNNGCDAMVYPWDEEHAKECSFMPCPFCGLEVFGKIPGMFSHLRNLCKISDSRQIELHGGAFKGGLLVVGEKADKSDTRIEIRMVTEDESKTKTLMNVEWNEDGHAYGVKIFPSLSIYDITTISLLAPCTVIPRFKLSFAVQNEATTMDRLRVIFPDSVQAHFADRTKAASCRVTGYTHVTRICYSTMSNQFENYDDAYGIGRRIANLLRTSLVHDPSFGTSEVLDFLAININDERKHLSMIKLIFPMLTINHE